MAYFGVISAQRLALVARENRSALCANAAHRVRIISL